MHIVLYVDKAIDTFGEEIAYLYKDTLNQFGIECIYTASYDSALILLSKAKYDAIICEPYSAERRSGTWLKTTDGFDFIKRIQKIYRKIPTIVLTTLYENDVINYLRENDMSMLPVVQKGFKSDIRLLQKLNEVLRLNINAAEIIMGPYQYNARIFISYAKEDSLEAKAIYETLKQNKFMVWIDKERLLPGQDWDLEIQRAIEECNFFLACMSTNSVSKEGYVQKELKRALDILDKQPEGSIYLLPVRLDECRVPKKFEKLQWCNYFEEDAMKQLLKAIKVGCERRGLTRTR